MKSTRPLAFLSIAVGALILSCTGGESPTRNHAPAATLVGLSAVFPPQVVDAAWPNADPGSDATAANASVGDRAAARWLGVDVHEPIETIRALADVDRRPNPKRFETLILSARDGRARMHQSAGMHAGLHPSGPWLEISGDNLTRDLPEEAQPMVQGHELHTAVLMPHARYTHLTYLGETPFDATEALEVQVQNQWGGSVSLFCSQQDTMLFGMRMAKTGEVPLADWESRNGLQIFRSATFTTPSTSTTTPTRS